MKLNWKGLHDVASGFLIGCVVGVIVIAGLTIWAYIETGHWFLPGMPPYLGGR